MIRAEIISSFFKWESCIYRGAVDPIQEIDVGHPLCLGSFLEKLARGWGGQPLCFLRGVGAKLMWRLEEVWKGHPLCFLQSLERTATLLSSIEGEIDVGELTWDIHLDLLYIKTVTML